MYTYVLNIAIDLGKIALTNFRINLFSNFQS